MPWLLVAGDNRLQVPSEVRIECDRGVALLRVPEDLRDGPSAPVRCANHRRGTMVVLHDHFDAFLDLGQHGVDIAGEFGLRNADRCHRFDHSVCPDSLSCSFPSAPYGTSIIGACQNAAFCAAGSTTEIWHL